MLFWELHGNFLLGTGLDGAKMLEENFMKSYDVVQKTKKSPYSSVAKTERQTWKTKRALAAG